MWPFDDKTSDDQSTAAFQRRVDSLKAQQTNPPPQAQANVPQGTAPGQDRLGAGFRQGFSTGRDPTGSSK